MRIEVIGSLNVVGRDGPIRVPGARPAAMLAMLTLAPGGMVPRATLIDRFWGERPDQQAAGSLRQTLYALRQALGPEGGRIGGQGGAVVFDLDGVLVDVHAVRAAPARLSPADRARLATLAGRELLAGLSLSAPGVEEWLRDERSAWRALVAERVRAAALSAFAAGDVEGTRALAMALAQADPGGETAQALLMRLDARHGPAAVRRRYEAFRAHLADDLGVAPSPRLAALAAALIGGGTAPAPTPAAAAELRWRLPPDAAQWGLAATARTVVIEELSRAGIRVFVADPGAAAPLVPFLIRGEIVAVGPTQTVLIEAQTAAREVLFVARLPLSWPLDLALFEGRLADRVRALGQALAPRTTRTGAGWAAALAPFATLSDPADPAPVAADAPAAGIPAPDHPTPEAPGDPLAPLWVEPAPTATPPAATPPAAVHALQIAAPQATPDHFWFVDEPAAVPADREPADTPAPFAMPAAVAQTLRALDPFDLALDFLPIPVAADDPPPAPPGFEPLRSEGADPAQIAEALGSGPSLRDDVVDAPDLDAAA